MDCEFVGFDENSPQGLTFCDGIHFSGGRESFDTQRYVSHWHVWFTVFVARFSPTNRRVLRCFLDLARFSLIRSHISTTKCLCYGRFIAI